jgi:hypothetical protein
VQRGRHTGRDRGKRGARIQKKMSSFGVVHLPIDDEKAAVDLSRQSVSARCVGVGEGEEIEQRERNGAVGAFENPSRHYDDRTVPELQALDGQCTGYIEPGGADGMARFFGSFVCERDFGGSAIDQEAKRRAVIDPYLEDETGDAIGSDQESDGCRR